MSSRLEDEQVAIPYYGGYNQWGDVRNQEISRDHNDLYEQYTRDLVQGRISPPIQEPATSSTTASGRERKHQPSQSEHDYELGGRVGRGHFGEIWTATKTDSPELYVLKRFFTEQGEEVKRSGLREIHFGLKLLPHSLHYFTRYVEYFEEGEELWLVFRYEGISLHQYLFQSFPMNEQVLQDTSSALRTLKTAHAEAYNSQASNSGTSAEDRVQDEEGEELGDDEVEEINIEKRAMATSTHSRERVEHARKKGHDRPQAAIHDPVSLPKHKRPYPPPHPCSFLCRASSTCRT
jgi:hypothetical protein